MRRLHLLIVEGNTNEARTRHAAVSGSTPSAHYANVLRGLAPSAAIDLCFPADPGANLPDPAGLDSYDGVAFTGSALNIYKAEPESLRQIELARSVFEAGVPFFGSCWGLQVATVAAGGTVRRSDKGRELGIARKIVLTEEGKRHPLHASKRQVFDAPAIHTDEVGERPEGMTVTASNSWSEVQAAEIRHGRGVFWGVQYHPEYTFGEMAAMVARYGAVLVREGYFASLEELERHVADLRALDADPSRRDIAWRLGIDEDLLDPEVRLAELKNWLERQVRPWTSRRGRG
jgi:GMP synthase (glutamine-hydrolysing)